MIAIWGNKEHLRCVFPLWFSHDGPKSKNKLKKSSLLSAQAGIYIYATSLGSFSFRDAKYHFQGFGVTQPPDSPTEGASQMNV